MSNNNSLSSSRLLLRIGILGAAQIARKNVAAIQTSTSCTLTAIASRTHSKATKFVEEHIIDPNVRNELVILSGDEAYTQLIELSSVEALYIPLPTSLHKEWVIKALRSGKHVLVEKPVALNTSDLMEMMRVAKEVNKFILDGTMFVHHPRTQQLMNTIRDESFGGEVVRINSEFTFLADNDFLQNNIRIKNGGDPLGCIGDLGWYSVRMAILCMNNNNKSEEEVVVPTKARVTLFRLNENGVPIDATCMVHFSTTKNEAPSFDYNQRVLTFHCSFIHSLRQRVEIYGTKQQSIQMTDFVIPQKGKPHTYELVSQSLTDRDLFAIPTTVTVNNKNNDLSQEVLMWNNFAQYCRATDNNAEDENSNSLMKQSYEICIQTQSVMDALMQSIEIGGQEISMV